MPVDLSRIGIDGLDSFAQRQYMEAQSDNLRSLARKNDQETQEAQQLQELNQKASRMMFETANDQAHADQDDDGETVQSLADPMEKLAKIFMYGGQPIKAAKFLSDASEIRKRESDMRNSEVTTQQARLENIIKGADIVGRKLGGARNQAEWEQGLREVEQAQIIEPHLMEQLKGFKNFNSDLAAYFADQARSASDKAQFDMAQRNFEQREKFSTIARSQEAQRIELQKARDEETRKHNEFLRKNGGDKATSATAPSDEDLKSVKTHLKNSVFKGVEIADEDLEGATSYIASRAKQIVKENKAISWDTAVQQAALQAQGSGKIKVGGGDKGWNILGTFDVGVKPDKGSFKNDALPLPKSKTQMVKGELYITAKGIGRWNGTSFESVD